MVDKVEAGIDAGEIDLASLDSRTASDAGAKVPILHPVSKEPIGVNITVLGKHSTTFRELVQERIDKRIRAEALAAKRGKSVEPRTAAEVEREALEMLVACTVGWETEIYETVEVDGKLVRQIKETKPTIKLGDERLPFNAQNALRVYSQIIWMREQVDDAIGDLENFIKA